MYLALSIDSDPATPEAASELVVAVDAVVAVVVVPEAVAELD